MVANNYTFVTIKGQNLCQIKNTWLFVIN